jgi:dimethylargininase
MQVGTHYYIGLSHRTNQTGAKQLIAILEKYNLSGSVVPVSDFLHLKTGVTSVDEKTLIATGEFIDHPDLNNFNIIPVESAEANAANCIRINDIIVISAGYPKTKALFQKLGTELIEVDISEFAKIDGGLTCLSLRF